ncbi:alpha-D-ribose 1-methylphosphonate 5-triphosphate synthase subunit PhnG [Paracoccus halophilus]|uniref:Alpha-D-ribose 1-methylphosphonate 5-triphosphate synthase subunit PhnG n=1 Tax=Paracoccus halophilus TaxID=376733 RepID=A0A099F3H7_9RHOB|nr:phosphonate C-P lyase system protein PhnG [Paracoccus halophilus]KGJ04833.1 phosphonate metabolism protein PhnG [Paracoccus halophilus]SFA51433.1 alpha-D-ribose 1-methylphosphonate 5-triphosphate synthase subunit PhnG [Paracoccus halophilus]
MPETFSQTDRREALGLLARAPAARLAELLPELPAHEVLRAPEIGTVMVRGRAGGTGSAFNLGEVTVTRASIRLHGGEVGHGYVQGRDKAHALRAALVDAMGQADPARVAPILTPLREEEDRRRARIAAEAAATRVEFFTLVRGEDE